MAAVDTLGYISRPSPPLRARTLAPTPSAGHAHAFLLASTDRSFQDFRARYRSVGTVYPTYFDCLGDGSLSGHDYALVSRHAQARQVKLLPRVSCQSGAVLNRILPEQPLREQWLSSRWHWSRSTPMTG